VNAVYYNKIQEKPEGEARDAYVNQLRDEYRQSIDIYKLASELVVDAVVPGERLRDEIRLRLTHHPVEPSPQRKHPVLPM
jgi:acetyl-CoA carboxylase carboxyltransferase component